MGLFSVRFALLKPRSEKRRKLPRNKGKTKRKNRKI